MFGYAGPVQRSITIVNETQSDLNPENVIAGVIVACVSALVLWFIRRK